MFHPHVRENNLINPCQDSKHHPLVELDHRSSKLDEYPKSWTEDDASHSKNVGKNRLRTRYCLEERVDERSLVVREPQGTMGLSCL